MWCEQKRNAATEWFRVLLICVFVSVTVIGLHIKGRYVAAFLCRFSKLLKSCVCVCVFFFCGLLNGVPWLWVLILSRYFSVATCLSNYTYRTSHRGSQTDKVKVCLGARGCGFVCCCVTVAYRGGWGVHPPRNSESPPKSCQTQPDCENC